MGGGSDGRIGNLLDIILRAVFFYDRSSERTPPTAELRMAKADSSISETSLSHDEVREAVVRSRGGKTAGVCNNNAEMIKNEGAAKTNGLHVV